VSGGVNVWSRMLEYSLILVHDFADRNISEVNIGKLFPSTSWKTVLRELLGCCWSRWKSSWNFQELFHHNGQGMNVARLGGPIGKNLG
jgi:hypothetical protein